MNSHKKRNITFLLIALCYGHIAATNDCTTPDGDPGQCVLVDDCEPLKTALFRIYGQDTIEHLERDEHVNQSTCGWDEERDMRKVCCPTETLAEFDPDMEGMFSELGGVSELPDDCGVSTANDSYSRIVGGFEVGEGQFPWIVALGYNDGNIYYPNWKCGGSIITAIHVLTAAHCALPNLIKVKAGTLNPWGPGIVGLVVKMYIHEKYDNVTDVFDIAVLKIQWLDSYGKPTALVRSAKVNWICLPKTPEMRRKSYEGYFPTVAGWGVEKWNTTIGSNKLLAVQLKVVKLSYCKQKYKKFTRTIVTINVICTGYEKGGLDSCQGDSGGPVMIAIITKDGKIIYFIIGIISKGYRCAYAGMPALSTRVGNFIPWIEAQIRKN